MEEFTLSEFLILSQLCRQLAIDNAFPAHLYKLFATVRFTLPEGLHIGIASDVEGKVVKTNNPYVEGSKVTLRDIDFDPLLSDPKGFKALSEKMETARGDDRKMMESLKGLQGLKITTDPEVSIEFTPDKKP